MDRLRALWPSSFGSPDAGDRLGPRGEKAAARYLRGRGYRIVARGQRDALGEIDLVAWDGKTIVFVEVKSRQSDHRGTPALAVDSEKQRRLTRLAVGYLRRHRLLDVPVRFDVIAVTWPEHSTRPEIEHFPAAFEASGYDGMYS